MLITTLCYIEHRGCYLMLHRTKKERDINEGKWIGVGGKFQDRESPEDCLRREVFEETGFSLQGWRFRGFITFLQENYETEYMCLYTAEAFLVPADTSESSASDPALPSPIGDSSVTSGDFTHCCPVCDHPAFASDDPADWPVPDCDEGELAWIPKNQVTGLNLWPGDRIFLKLLTEREDFFSLKLRYAGDELLAAELDGVELNV